MEENKSHEQVHIYDFVKGNFEFTRCDMLRFSEMTEARDVHWPIDRKLQVLSFELYTVIFELLYNIREKN